MPTRPPLKNWLGISTLFKPKTHMMDPVVIKDKLINEGRYAVRRFLTLGPRPTAKVIKWDIIYFLFKGFSC